MTALLFPGQGSQTPGMGRDFYEQSACAREVFDEAASLASDGFLDTIFDGPDDELARADKAQPALITVETAIARHLLGLGHAPSVCAGHSFGEFPALVAAGALEFRDAFQLSVARGECMASDVPAGGMAAVMGLSAADIEAALPEGAYVANYNGPAQTIISGATASLDAAETALKEAGAKRLVRLNVAGPFHTKYMQSAQDRFRDALDKVGLKPPAVRFVSSVTGGEVSEPDEIRTLLAGQICRPVRWTQVMQAIGPVQAVEAGPGRVLQGLARRTPDAPAVKSAATIEAANALEISA